MAFYFTFKVAQFQATFPDILYSVFCDILYVKPFHKMFWIRLLISFMAFAGVLITLETYIKGVRAKLLRTVIFPFNDNFLPFRIFSVDFRFEILCWKFCL